MARPSVLPSRDYGALGTVLQWVIALGCGVGIATFIRWDGIFGLRQQIEQLGPYPPLVNDVPYLYTLAILLVVGIFIMFFGWVLKVGSLDRPLLALMAFSLNADVIPGLFQISMFGFLFMLISRGMKQGDIPIHFTALVFPIILVVVSYCTTMLVVESPIGVTTKMSFRVSYLMMVLLLPCVIRTRRQFEMFIHYLIVAALISAGAELVQMVLSGVVGKPMTFSETSYNRVTTPYGVYPRLTGLMYHPNHQSNLMATEAILALWIATRPKRLLSAGRRVFFATAYVVLVFAVFFTWSRSGWLCVGVASMAVPIVRWPRFSPVYLGILGVLGGLAYSTGVAEQVYEIVRSFNASSADFRWHIDDIATQAFLWSPAIGVGVGGSTTFYNPYQLQVHDTYLQALSEMGLFGSAIFLLLFGMVFGRLFHVALKGRNELDRDWAWAFLFAAIVTLIQSSFAMFLWIKFLWGMVAMMECLVLISRNQQGAAEPDDLLVLRPMRHADPAKNIPLEPAKA